MLIVFQIQVNLQVFSQGTQKDSNKKMILNLKRFHKSHTFLNGFIATVINLIKPNVFIASINLYMHINLLIQ